MTIPEDWKALYERATTLDEQREIATKCFAWCREQDPGAGKKGVAAKLGIEKKELRALVNPEVAKRGRRHTYKLVEKTFLKRGKR